jgi:hypothetical protein
MPRKSDRAKVALGATHANICVTMAIARDKCFTYKLNKVSPIVDRRLIFLRNVGQRRLQRWLAAQKPEGGVTAAQVGFCSCRDVATAS